MMVMFEYIEEIAGDELVECYNLRKKFQEERHYRL